MWKALRAHSRATTFVLTREGSRHCCNVFGPGEDTVLGSVRGAFAGSQARLFLANLSPDIGASLQQLEDSRVPWDDPWSAPPGGPLQDFVACLRQFVEEREERTRQAQATIVSALPALVLDGQPDPRIDEFAALFGTVMLQALESASVAAGGPRAV